MKPKCSFLFLFLVAVTILTSACSTTTIRMQNKEDVISAYLDALTRRDKNGVLSLCAPDHEGVEEIVAEKIRKLGGKTFSGITVDYAEEINPAYARAAIRGMFQEGGVDYSFEEAISLQNIDGVWYIVFGRHKDAIDAPTTQP